MFATLAAMDDDVLRALQARLERSRRSAACLPQHQKVALSGEELVDVYDALLRLLSTRPT